MLKIERAWKGVKEKVQTTALRVALGPGIAVSKLLDDLSDRRRGGMVREFDERTQETLREHVDRLRQNGKLDNEENVELATIYNFTQEDLTGPNVPEWLVPGGIQATSVDFRELMNRSSRITVTYNDKQENKTFNKPSKIYVIIPYTARHLRAGTSIPGRAESILHETHANYEKTYGEPWADNAFVIRPGEIVGFVNLIGRIAGRVRK